MYCLLAVGIEWQVAGGPQRQSEFILNGSYNKLQLFLHTTLTESSFMQAVCAAICVYIGIYIYIYIYVFMYTHTHTHTHTRTKTDYIVTFCPENIA